jgi:hypothetical protein
MVPVSLGVTLLDYFGILSVIAAPLHGVFRLLGLPGEAAVVFLTSVVLNIYSAIAVIETLSLNGREITILALMCLIAHNFFVEIPVVARTGSRPVAMIALRIAAAAVGGVALNLLLPAQVPQAESPPFSGPGSEGSGVASEGAVAETVASRLMPILGDWALDTLQLIATVVGIIVGLMIFTRLLEHYGVIAWTARLFRPVFRVFGLPEDAAFLWVVANTLGLAYGAAVMIDHVEKGKMDRATGDILNHHLVISHSLLEDTLLFVAIGVGAGWIVLPRIALAAGAVWGVRLVRRINAAVV